MPTLMNSSSDTIASRDRSAPSPSTPLRVALVGCGAIAQSLHLPVLAGHEDIRLAALVDKARDRAGRLAKGYGVPLAISEASELNTSLVDAAILATPAAHHASGAIDLMRRGIHVLVEKPMALNLREAEEMVRVADETGCQLAVGYFRRLYPSLRLAKALVDSEFFGPAVGYYAAGGGRYSWAAATLANMRRDLAGGGVLIDYGSHILDMLFFLFEEPADVLAYQDNDLGGVEADCIIDARLRHRGKAIDGRIELARTRDVGNFIRIECERGQLVFDVNERFRIRAIPRNQSVRDPFDDSPRAFWCNAQWDNQPEDEPWPETFRRQIDDWLDAIRHRRAPRLSGKSAVATARLIDACYAQRAPMAEPWVSEGLQVETVGPSVATALGARVLLTGGTGFIGARAAEILALGHGCQVRALVHNPGNASRLARLPVELVQADLDDEAVLRRLTTDCDAVVHCAVGTAWGQRKEIFKVTVDGTRKLAEAALANGVKRFVHLSTISVYGDDQEMTGSIDETTPIKPVTGSEYGESKAAAEKVVADLAARGLAAVIFRPARVFGPFSRIFIERPLAAMAENRFRWLGDPRVPADMVYVDSVVHSIVLALKAPADRVKGETFVISDGDPISWYDFYDYFAKALGIELNTVRNHATGTDQQSPRSGVLQGIRSIVTSPEFKQLGRKVLSTDPVGTLPRWTIENIPGTERILRQMVGADDSLPVYKRDPRGEGDIVVMGSGGALANIDKLRRVLGFQPPVAFERAMELTLAWARHAHVVSGR